MQNHGGKYFARRPTSPLNPTGFGQNSTYSEHGHIANQIKWNYEM